jgi:serine/threonine protein kinase
MIAQHKVGPFEIRGFLGRGAIGDVHLAWDPERQAEVALKLIRTQHADPEMLQAERNGVAIQDQLAAVAPQVAAVYEHGEDGDFFWVAMEYVNGCDLSQELDQGPLSETRAVLIARQLCAMLEICHRFSAEIAGRRIAGIVHGDIKPENIRLQENDRVRVLDFGIAKHLSQTRRFTVNLFGSLPYTPPERLDRGAVDRHSDLWAVGVVLYLMLSGRPPFEGANAEELERKIRRGEPPAPLPAEISPKLKKIVQKSLAFEVTRRYSDAAEMKADLDAWLEGLPLPGESAAGAAGEEGARPSDLNATRRTTSPLGESPPGGPASPPHSAEPAALGETRRTSAPAVIVPFRRDDSGIDATRRTAAPQGGQPGAQPGATGLSVPATAETSTSRRSPRPWRRWRLAALAAAATLIVISQAWVRSEAREIQHQLVTAPSPDLDAALDRYARADRWTLGFGFGLGAVREELRMALEQQAQRILDGYHGDSPRSAQREWQRAVHLLQGALDLRYDREVRAHMLYSQAQVDRIESQTLRANGKRTEADKKLDDAVAGFRDAARRAPDWPDPYLGLARVYSYETFNLDALQKSIGELEKRGYPQGRREKAMLADGFRRQGIDLQARAEKNEDAEGRVDGLEQARDAFEQALSYYSEIQGYGNARANRADVDERLHGVEAELGTLHRPTVIERLLGLR